MSPFLHTPPEILVVEDDLPLQRALARVLASAGYEVSAHEEAEPMLAGLLGQPRRHRPTCILMDVNLGGLDGIAAQKLARQIDPDIAVVFMSAQQDAQHVNQAWRDGAVDFLFKPFTSEELLRTLGRALQRRPEAEAPALDPQLLERIEALTPRQRQVLAAVAQGRTHVQIGAQLGISPRTVKLHRAAMMQRLRCRSLADLVRLYEACKHLLAPQDAATLH